MRHATRTLARAQLRDAFRSRWLAGYTVFFLLLTEGILRFSDGDAKAVASLGAVVLMVIPVATLVLATSAVYAARDFTELLLAQPIRRRSLFAGLWLGLALPAGAAFLTGVGVPFLARGGGEPSQRGALLTLLALGAALTLVFTALAFCIAMATDDRLRGLGAALCLWLGTAVLYDGIVLVVAAVFGDRPIERALLALTFVNPVDLARILLLLRLDVAALMGYTGAVFQRFFGSAGGIAAAAIALVLWIALPAAIGARQFQRKDF